MRSRNAPPLPVRRAPRRWILIGLVLALVAASCTGGGDGGAVDDPSVDGPRTSEPTTTGADDGTLRLAIVRPRSIDPAASSPASWVDMVLVDLFYDTLTEIRPDGEAGPGLATFAADTGRTTWRFTLVDDASFADGTPITAADVVFSIDRMRNVGPASLASLRLEGIESVRAVDQRAVDVVLAQPSARLPAVLASPLFPIVDDAAIDRAIGGDQTPNASSGYTVEFPSVERFVLTRRRGSGPERIEIEMFASADAAFDAFLAGEADLAPVPPDRVGEAVDRAGTDGLVPFQALLYLGINTARSPLNDLRVRRALAFAIDRQRLADAVFGRGAIPHDGYLPAGVVGDRPDRCADHCDHDPQRAERLLREVFGTGGPPSLTIATDGSPTQQRAAGVIARQLAAAGLDAPVVDFPSGTLDTLISGGQHELFLLGWLGTGRIPDPYLTPLLASSSLEQVFGLRDEALDLALVTAETEPVASVRRAAWHRAEDRALDLMPAVPLVQLQTMTVRSPRVTALRHRVDGTIDLDSVELGGG